MTTQDKPKRPASVTLAAVVLLVACVLLAFVMVYSLILSYKFYEPSVLSRRNDFPRALSIIPQLYVAAWGIITALGILRLRPWARVSIIVLSLLVFHFFLSGAFGAFVMHIPTNSDSKWMLTYVRGLALLSFGCVGAAALSVIQFTDKTMDVLFESAPRTDLVPENAISPTPSPSAQQSVAAATFPLSVKVIGFWLLVVWPLMLYSILLRLNRFLTFPTMPAGRPLFGPTASSYCVAITVLAVILGLGLLRRTSWARFGGIAFFTFTFISEVAAAARPEYSAHSFLTVNPTYGLSVPTWAYSVSALWEAAPAAVALYFLANRKLSSQT